MNRRSDLAAPGLVSSLANQLELVSLSAVLSRRLELSTNCITATCHFDTVPVSCHVAGVETHNTKKTASSCYHLCTIHKQNDAVACILKA